MRRRAAVLVGVLAVVAPAGAWAQPVTAAAQPAEAPATRLVLPAPGQSAVRSWWVPTLHGVGLLGAQRVGASVLWSRAFALDDGAALARQFARAYTEPPKFDPGRRPFEWDGDWWVINVVGHGLMGSELYLRARQCGHGPWASLAFTAAASAAWEYLVEAWHVRPSALDLVWTPLAGMGLGELRRAVWRWAGGAPRAARVIVRAVVDPFGELERALGTRC